jgi:competence protein ComEA
MEPFMPLVFPSSINPALRAAVLLAAFAVPAAAQLPDGPGKTETQKLCSQCHEIERSISLRQDRAGWQATVDKMVSLGAQASDRELAAVTDYLAAHFTSDELPRVNINKAAAIELESRLSLKRSEAAAVIAWRTKNGPFRSLEDLKQVPGVDFSKLDTRKDRIAFQ